MKLFRLLRTNFIYRVLKVDGAYYHDTLLTQEMLHAIRHILVIALYSSKTGLVPLHTGQATRFNCYAGKRQTSSDQNSGHQIPQTT